MLELKQFVNLKRFENMTIFEITFKMDVRNIM